MSSFLLVALGGFLGSSSRFLVSKLFPRRFIATFFVNVLGSLLLGLLMRLYMNETIGEQIWLLFGVGYAGAFTTFSTFSVDSVSFLVEKRYGSALMYILATFLMTFTVVYLVVST